MQWALKTEGQTHCQVAHWMFYPGSVTFLNFILCGKLFVLALKKKKKKA